MKLKKSFKLVGNPLTHSISPYVHERLFKICGFEEFEYGLFNILPQEFDLKFYKLKNLSGFNVTMPYKTRILEKLTVLDESVLKNKSCNTVLVEGDSLTGYNTDCFGFLKTLEILEENLCGEILLLGFGGSGKMIAVKTLEAGGRLTVAVREESVGKALDFIDCYLKSSGGGLVNVVSLENIPLRKYDVLVNATPIGMNPNLNGMPVDLKICALAGSVVDLIYNPCETLLLKLAKRLGIKAVGGVAMLVWQAVLANEIWNNMKIEDGVVKKIIEEVEQKLKNIAN